MGEPLEVVTINLDSETDDSSVTSANSSIFYAGSADHTSTSRASDGDVTEVPRIDLTQQISNGDIVRVGRAVYARGPGEGKPYFIEDLTEGKSKPVRVHNALDDMDYGAQVFTYTEENVYTNRRGPPLQNYCNCEGECRPKSCKCRAKSSIKIKDDGKIDHLNLRKKIDFFNNYLLECSEHCGCKGKCDNTFTKTEMPFRFEIFRRKHVGFGCRTLDRIKAGSFVCEFIGEVMRKRKAERRNEQTFMYTSFFNEADQNKNYVIDPYRFGNASRFFNHSCNENLSPFRFFKDTRWRDRPHLGFYAKRDIIAGEELTIDYGKTWWKMNLRSKEIQYCCCDADYCVLPSPKRFQMSEEDMKMECEQLNREIKEYTALLSELRKEESELKKRKEVQRQREKKNHAVKRSKRITEKNASIRTSPKAKPKAP